MAVAGALTHHEPLSLWRAELRRAAWQVCRAEREKPGWEGGVGFWMVAPYVPGVLRRLRSLHPLGNGVYAVGAADSPFLWVAANELPLVEALIPFKREPWMHDRIVKPELDAVAEAAAAKAAEAAEAAAAQAAEAASRAARQEARRSLRDVLSLGGLVLTPEQEARIAAEVDVERLHRWHHQAITATSAEEALA